MKKNVFLLITFLLFQVGLYGQNCKFINDTVSLVTFYLYPKNSHAVIMNGIISKDDSISFNTNNIESFVSSFFNVCKYMPISIYTEEQLLEYCDNDDRIVQFIRNSPNYEININQQLLNRSKGIGKRLSTGEYIIFEFSKLVADFVWFKKEYDGFSSLEFPLRESQIDSVYFPYRILECKKPSRKEMKELKASVDLCFVQ